MFVCLNGVIIHIFPVTTFTVIMYTISTCNNLVLARNLSLSTHQRPMELRDKPDPVDELVFNNSNSNTILSMKRVPTVLLGRRS